MKKLPKSRQWQISFHLAPRHARRFLLGVALLRSRCPELSFDEVTYLEYPKAVLVSYSLIMPPRSHIAASSSIAALEFLLRCGSMRLSDIFFSYL